MGYCPITITDIGIKTKLLASKDHFIPYYSSENFSQDINGFPLPRTLQDGETLRIPLSSRLSEIVAQKQEKILVHTYDAEGQVCDKH